MTDGTSCSSNGLREPTSSECAAISAELGDTFSSRLTPSDSLSGCVRVSPVGGGEATTVHVLSTGGLEHACSLFATCFCVQTSFALSSPPPSTPPTPSPLNWPSTPPSGPSAPPLAPGTLSPCVPGQSTDPRCHVTIEASQPCMSASLLGRDCITIDRPFHVALVGGRCYDNLHNVVEDGCFDLPSSVVEGVLNYYPSLYGVVFSASLKGSPEYSTPYWRLAPPLDAHNFSIPIKAGHQFVLTLSERTTQIFETPLSQYSHTVITPSPSTPPPSPPSSPPPPLPSTR